MHSTVRLQCIHPPLAMSAKLIISSQSVIAKLMQFHLPKQKIYGYTHFHNLLKQQVPVEKFKKYKQYERWTLVIVMVYHSQPVTFLHILKLVVEMSVSIDIDKLFIKFLNCSRCTKYTFNNDSILYVWTTIHQP